MLEVSQSFWQHIKIFLIQNINNPMSNQWLKEQIMNNMYSKFCQQINRRDKQISISNYIQKQTQTNTKSIKKQKTPLIYYYYQFIIYKIFSNQKFLKTQKNNA
ncbi:hypothetical protein ABPG74_003363 [Tetrahymena malaccensis]